MSLITVKFEKFNKNILVFYKTEWIASVISDVVIWVVYEIQLMEHICRLPEPWFLFIDNFILVVKYFWKSAFNLLWPSDGII